MNTDRKRPLAAMTASMVIFGTIGLVRRMIALPAEVIAFARGIMGAVFLLLVLRCRGKNFDRKAVGSKMGWLFFSGALIGLNWILLFKAYDHTTIAIATLCYYMQPVIVIALSPVVFREKITGRKLLCVLLSVTGMVLVSGLTGGEGGGNRAGIALGLGAAALYACVVMLNKKVTGVPVYEKTIVQMAGAALALLPYMAAAGTLKSYTLSSTQIICLLIAGIVHTGIAYALYFGALERLPAQTSALFSYIDPVTAVLLSAVFLREPMSPAAAVGTVLIIGSAIYSELAG